MINPQFGQASSFGRNALAGGEIREKKYGYIDKQGTFKTTKTESMRTVIALLCVASVTFGQKDRYLSFAAGTDFRSPGDDLIVQTALVSQDVEVNLSYEHYADSDFSRFAFGLGYHFRLYAYPGGREVVTTFIPSIEPTLINRWGNWGGGLGERDQSSSHLSLSLNLSLNWKLNDTSGVELTANLLPRTDLEAMYGDQGGTSIGGTPVVTSVFLKYVYRFDMN